jgi:hypothetical protein
MSTDDVLSKEASEIAADIQNRIPFLEVKLEEAKAQVANIDAELNTARLSLERAADFLPTLGSDFQCPSCWIHNKTRATLRPVAGDSTKDILKCNVCNEQFSIPF